MKIKSKIIYVLTIIFFSLQYIYADDSVATILLGGLAVLIFVLSGIGNLRFLQDRFPLMVFVFVVYAVLSYAWAVSPPLAIKRGQSLIKIFVMVSLLYVSFKQQFKTEQLLKIIMWGGFVAIVYIILTVGVGSIAYLAQLEERLGGNEDLTINVNVLGTLAANVIIINTYFKLYDHFSWDILIDLPCLVMVAVCGSRRAMLVLFVGIVMLFLIKNSKKLDASYLLKITTVLSVSLIAIYFILSLPLFALISERMEGLVNSIKGEGVVDNSTMARELMIQVGYKLFKESPIIGIGLDNARAFNPKVGTYLHNNYIELAADLGIIGFVLYYSMHCYVIMKAVKLKKTDNKLYAIVLTLMVSLLISDIGVVSYYYKEYYFFLILSFIYINEIGSPKNKFKKKYLVA